MAIHVGMAIDQPGQDGASLHIEVARLWPDMGRHGIALADSQDLAMTKRDRLRDRVARIHCNNLRVAQNNVGGTCHEKLFASHSPR
jgi:hypothetical protein